jgi:hypothetical protein
MAKNKKNIADLIPTGVLSKGPRLVFFIGDDGAVLVYMKGQTVMRRLYAPESDPDSVRAMTELLQSDPKAPVAVLVDMMDQSYIKQSLPPVTKFSVHKLIKRRLERDFAPEDIKGALPIGREKGGRKDWNYLLISLANSPQLIGWLDYILEFDNPFQGIHLAPVEAEKFIQQMSQATMASDKASRWQFLVSHNKVSGFRQVIIKDGRLTFTRLAQPVGDPMPEVVAGSIEQEITNTIEYLKRLSYTEDQGLDIYVIVAEDIKGAIDKERLNADHVSLLTPHDVAGLLKLNQAAMPEDHYADVIISSFFASAPRRVLALSTKQSRRIQMLERGALALKVATLSIAIFLAVAVLFTLITLPGQLAEIRDIEKEITSIQTDFDKTEDAARLLPADINRIIDVVSVHKALTNPDLEPLNYIKKLRQVMDSSLKVKDFTWRTKGREPLQQLLEGEKVPVEFDVTFEFLNNRVRTKTLRGEIREKLRVIDEHFEGFSMVHSALPGDVERGRTFRTSFDDPEALIDNEFLDGSPVYVTVTLSNDEIDANLNNSGRRQ